MELWFLVSQAICESQIGGGSAGLLGLRQCEGLLAFVYLYLVCLVAFFTAITGFGGGLVCVLVVVGGMVVVELFVCLPGDGLG